MFVKTIKMKNLPLKISLCRFKNNVSELVKSIFKNDFGDQDEVRIRKI